MDAAKDAADVVLLQKDLNVLEQGVLEGRKTFTIMPVTYTSPTLPTIFTVYPSEAPVHFCRFTQ